MHDSLKKTLLIIGLSVLYGLAGASFCPAAESAPAEDLDYLKNLSLENLLDTEVSSVSKKMEKLADAPAAVFVITAEDIRRSGATNIPEALRMAPGVEVAQIDANKWAVSIRDFNDRYADKLLVLIDGRTVYTPLYSGVFWEIQDTVLADIERIEVIRGPGATLWGANAVNGVINIITKNSADTQGGLAIAAAGTEERLLATLRYGGNYREDLNYRVYGKWIERDGNVDTAGNDTPDDWRMLRGGLRMDWQVSPADLLTFQGDFFDAEEGQTVTTPSLTPPYSNTTFDEFSKSGGNLLLRWTKSFSANADLSIQTYYDHIEIDELDGLLKRDTFDIELQNRFGPGWRQEITWGLGFRINSDNAVRQSPIAELIPSERTDRLYNAFVQDSITIVPERWRFVIGSKFEHNDYTGFEVQPNGRLLWTPNDRNSIWASVARAVRTPSRVNSDASFTVAVLPPGSPQNPGPLPLVVTFTGNEDLESEELMAYELGYRTQATESVFVDVAAFYNDYDNLASQSLPSSPIFDPGPPPVTTISQAFTNNQEAETYGLEIALEWRTTDWWSLIGTYTFIDGEISNKETGTKSDIRAPRNQISLRSNMNLPYNLELDIWARYVDRIQNTDIDSYMDLDIHLGWFPIPELELVLVGQNLIDSQRQEFQPQFVQVAATEVQRGVYFKAAWHF